MNTGSIDGIISESDILLLCIFKNAIAGQYMTDLDVNSSLLREMLAGAEIHQILPLICEAIYMSPAVRKDNWFIYRKHQAVEQTVNQEVRTLEFLDLYHEMSGKNLAPVVVKGSSLRDLYPWGSHRCSLDEDILVSEDAFSDVHAFLLSEGLQLMQKDRDLRTAGEVSYCRPATGLYLEVHKKMFSGPGMITRWNPFFEKAMSRTGKMCLRGTELRVLDHTDMLFYLVLHALKHFLYSGFGIRQVSDICLFAAVNAARIDWEQLRHHVCRAHAEHMLTALFRIGCRFLLSDAQTAVIKANWNMDLPFDEAPLLKDILAGGITGNASLDRLHSSSITLQAVMGKGNKTDRVLRTVFPSAKELSGRYPYLEKAPVLLPAAWISRIVDYMKESRIRDRGGGNASETVRIAEERIRLLSQYGLLPENRNE